MIGGSRSRASARPLRVLHVLTVSESLIFLRGQSKFMRTAGIETHVVTSPGALTRQAASEGFTLYTLPMPRRITPIQDLRTVWALFRLMRRIRPEIVHAHTPKGGLLGMVAALIAGVPRRVYHMRGLPLETARGVQKTLLCVTERLACFIAHRVVCVSQSVRLVAVRERLAPRSKLRVLASGSGNGVDAEERFCPERLKDSRSSTRQQFSIPPEAVVVLFIGRLAKDKGVGDLLRAWVTLRTRYPQLVLIVAGPRDDRDAIEPDLLATLVSDDRVRMISRWTDTPPLYAAADLVTLPSHREGFPNVPLEAAAMELPVIVSDATGCIDSVVAGETGLIVPVSDSSALARAIERYVLDSQLRRAHGAAGRQRVLQAFQQITVWQELLRLYLALLRWRPLPEAILPHLTSRTQGVTSTGAIR